MALNPKLVISIYLDYHESEAERFCPCKGCGRRSDGVVAFKTNKMHRTKLFLCHECYDRIKLVAFPGEWV